MNPDVIEMAFAYGVERRGVRKFNYVESIVRNWYDMGAYKYGCLTRTL